MTELTCAFASVASALKAPLRLLRVKLVSLELAK